MTAEANEAPRGRRRVKPVANGKATRVAFDPDDFRQRFNMACDSLCATFVNREDAIDVIALATLTRNNFLLIGDAGTAKTALIRLFMQHIKGASLFSALCGSFTTLDELVGPPDIKKFQAGEWGRVLAHRLADVDFAFLDEVMKSNDGTINSLLSILNERVFEDQPIPLHTVGAATNWPEVRQRTEKVEALYDRFVLRLHVLKSSCEAKPGEAAQHTEMLRASLRVKNYQPTVHFTLDEVRAAGALVDAVTVSDKILEKLTEIIGRLDKNDNVHVGDRRSVKSLDVMRARAWLDGRDSVGLQDFDVLRYVLWTNEVDIPAVEGAVATLDREIVKNAVEKIDKVRKDYQQLKGQPREQRIGQAAALVKDLARTGKELMVLLESGQLTPKGHDQLENEMRKLKNDYVALRKEVKHELGLDQGGDE